MKKWIAPAIVEMNVKMTAAPVDVENMTSGQLDQIDLGTCHNPYWEGNGLSKDEAIEENPYWGGGWGGSWGN